MKIGLQFYEDFLLKIPRPEINEVIQRVRATANKLYGEGEIDIVGAGSFRRGKQECGDVDLLLTRRSNVNPSNELHRIVMELKAKGLITHDLGESSCNEEIKPGESRSYLGVYQLAADLPHRRIDMKMYLKSEFAFALLFFTSGKYFNRSMRFYSKQMGLSLSDHRLIPVTRSPDKEKMSSGPPFECETEQEIFEVLGLDYVPPSDREVEPNSRQSASTKSDWYEEEELMDSSDDG